MADKAHRLTDEKLEEMEKRLSAIYSRAEKEIQKTADEYFSKFAAEDAKKRKLVEDGKMTEEEYTKWRKSKVMYGKRFAAMKEDVARQLLSVNKTAIAYVNGELPEVYSINYNALAGSVDGVGGYSFTLVDADTVKNLATTDTSLLPYKAIDPAKDIPWNMKKINAETLQGVLQGESMDKIAKRLRNVQEMNKTQAIRSARTIVTGAENKGRQDSYARAEADGIILQKEWIATNDSRTRHSHAVLDGAIVDQDKKFDNGLMYPGDPSGRPEEVYNCRCTIAAKVNGFKKVQVGKATEKAISGDEITSTEMQIFDSIRDKKRENLVVYDDSGKVVHREGGTKSHTGYEAFDYRGLHTAHNHPVGVGYYPSGQDLVTLHSSRAKSMTVVSPNHTIKFIRTKDVIDDFYDLSSEAAVSNAQVYGLESPFGNMSPQQYRQKHGLTMKEINAMRAEYQLERIKRIMETAGYKVIIL